jgi:hypothetical protein
LGLGLIAFGLEASPLPLQAIAAPSANPHSLTTLGHGFVDDREFIRRDRIRIAARVNA